MYTPASLAIIGNDSRTEWSHSPASRNPLFSDISRFEGAGALNRLYLAEGYARRSRTRELRSRIWCAAAANCTLRTTDIPGWKRDRTGAARVCPEVGPGTPAGQPWPATAGGPGRAAAPWIHESARAPGGPVVITIVCGNTTHTRAHLLRGPLPFQRYFATDR